MGGTPLFGVPLFLPASMPAFRASALWNGGNAAFRHSLLPAYEHAHISGLCSPGMGGSTAFQHFPHPKTHLCVCQFWGTFYSTSMSTFWASALLGWEGSPPFGVSPFLEQGVRIVNASSRPHLQACPPFGPLLSWDRSPETGCGDRRHIPAFPPASMPTLWASAPLRRERTLLLAFPHPKKP